MSPKSFAATLLLAAPILGSLASAAMANDVLMFDSPPGVDALRQDLAPPRTRSIEIGGTAAATPAAVPTAQKAAYSEPARTEPAKAPKTVGFHIQFAFDSAGILPQSRPFLDQVGKVMQLEPRLAMEVEGYTDAKGSDSYNMALSQRRAEAVKDYLVQSWHVSADRLDAVGKGKAEPLVADPLAPENRRVQFRPANAPAS
jgi:outer membrane protein OmpA-like peptidoglycan-associated protein